MTTAHGAVDQMLAAVDILASTLSTLEDDAPLSALEPSVRLVERRLRRVHTLLAQRADVPLHDELPATWFTPEDTADRRLIEAALPAPAVGAIPSQRGGRVRPLATTGRGRR
ncbi:hypothetical protein [Cellulomonas endophytica]|uniref:hypothetical protein n=1 Tax=Cellulomonas endophytica TaxID=2494735 RepID=UPI001013988A|nr:hypothetical protein [Cellulomonas endophytica]